MFTSKRAAADEATSEASRQALLRCGMQHLQTASHGSISVRNLASCANLSAGAPYYHFGTRRGLLAALALEGFTKLNQEALDIVERFADDPRHTLVVLAHGFVGFTLDNPYLFDLMYESELTHPVDPILQPSFQTAFNIIVEAIAAARGPVDRQQNIIRAVSFWTSMFGLTRLLRLQLLDPFFQGQALDVRGLMIEEAVDSALRTATI